MERHSKRGCLLAELDPLREGNHRWKFTKAMRLRKGHQFQAVFQRRVSVSDKSMVVYGLWNDVGHGRIGLSISKRVTRTAPARNRWKRILREAYRLDHETYPPGLDLVILARSPLPGPLSQVRQSLARLLVKLARRLGPMPGGPAPDQVGPDHQGVG